VLVGDGVELLDEFFADFCRQDALTHRPKVRISSDRVGYTPSPPLAKYCFTADPVSSPRELPIAVGCGRRWRA
jgi:hypothetical protein